MLDSIVTFHLEALWNAEEVEVKIAVTVIKMIIKNGVTVPDERIRKVNVSLYYESQLQLLV